MRRKREISSSAMLFLIYVFGFSVYLLGQYADQALARFWNGYRGGLGMTVMTVAGLYVYKVWLKGEYAGSLKIKNTGRGLLMMLPVLLLTVPEIGRIGFEKVTPAGIVFAVLAALMGGVGEEAAFRAMPCAWLTKDKREGKDFLKHAALVALIFALLRLTDLLSGTSVVDTLLNVGYSYGYGLIAAAVFLRCGTILPCMIVHTLYDIPGRLAAAFPREGLVPDETLSTKLILTGAALLIGSLSYLYLKRGNAEAEMNSLWTEKWRADACSASRMEDEKFGV